MTTLKMAVRNIVRQKKRTILLGGAIAFGVMIITLVGSLTSGLALNANTTLTSLLGGHVYVTGSEVSASGRQVTLIREAAALEEALLSIEDQIDEIHFRSQAGGEIIFGSSSEQIQLAGVDWNAEATLAESLDLIQGEVSDVRLADSIIVPEPLMEELGVVLGESVVVRLTSITGQQTVGEFVIRGTVADTGSFGLASGYVSRGYLNPIIGMTPEQYQRVNIGLSETTNVEQVARTLESELVLLGKLEVAEQETEDGPPGFVMGGMGFDSQIGEEDRWDGTRFSVTTINDTMEPVLTIVNLLDQVALGLFVVLLAITMVGLLNTFRMILIERTREIGTLRAVGMQRNDVRNMFLYEALTLAVVGAVAGMILSTVLGAIGASIPFSSASLAFSIFLEGGTLAFPFNLANVISVLAILTAGTLFSAYLPARQAARMRPADALRTSY